MNSPVTIVVADLSPLYRQAVAIAIRQFISRYRLIEAESLLEVESWLGNGEKIDLLVVDRGLAGIKAPEDIKRLARGYDAVIAMTTVNADCSMVRWARSAAVKTLLPKGLPSTQFVEALQLTLSGGCWYPEQTQNHQEAELINEKVAFHYLSSSELRVISRVRDGWKNKQIADQLNLSECTIKSHLTNTYRKLEIDNRTQLATMAMQWPNLK
ncbi:response regulator transcription factor [Motiliproteus sp. MSK22-1]|uniref:response regulator transcription factor n=1 Tax=Motiliproteus sp. MSK22-1 TaxID=1897630 RepID=UPI0009782962|nr:response regulator transcription factor [Motiliproteus sp. MSK22-1]OMH39792.1 hypothetical protein BGP75_01695 [Motiliproteus sp. MSK22-1]